MSDTYIESVFKESESAMKALAKTIITENEQKISEILRLMNRIAALEAENEALKIVLDGICEHVQNVPYGDLPGEVEALREDAERWRIARISNRISVDVRMDPKGMFLGRHGGRLDKCVDQIRKETNHG